MVLVQLHLGQYLSFAGTEEPAAYATLLSIGAISPSQNKAISKLVSDILQAKLSVPPNRYYLSVCRLGPGPGDWLLCIQRIRTTLTSLPALLLA